MNAFQGGYHFDSEEANRLNNEGIRFIKEHDYDQAEEKFIAASRLEPENPTLLNNLGNVYKNKGALSKAMVYYNESYIFSDSTFLLAVYNIARTYEEMGEYDKSLEEFKSILPRTSDENMLTMVKFEIAHILITQNKCSEAGELYERIKVNLSKHPAETDRMKRFEEKMEDCEEDEYKSNSEVVD